MERKVKFRLERVYNAQLGAMECVVHRENLKPMAVGLAKKDIALVAVVANTMACCFDNLAFKEGDNLVFELTIKVNQK